MEAVEAAPAPEEEPSDDDLDMLTAFTLEEPVAEEAPAVEPEQPEETSLSEPETTPDTGGVAGAAAGFDFGDISLDLDTPAEEIPPVAEVAPGASSGRLEVDTKLELADAYLGIGDKEGARELLEEVLKEGSDEQIARAQEAIGKLS